MTLTPTAEDIAANALEMAGEELAVETTGMASKLLSRDALRTLPAPSPLIDNVLDQGTTALLFGPWGTGKSFIALDWACCIASGRPWQSRTVVPGRVLYVAAEGAFGLAERVDAWEVGWQTTVPDEQLSVYPAPVNLTKAGQVARLSDLVERGRFDVVVLDTLARCMVGADENSAKDAGVVVDALTTVRQATPEGLGVVLAVHHAGKDGRTLRGSSAFESGVDTVYQVVPDGGGVDVERTKRKDGPPADRHRLRIAPVMGTGSAVMECLTGGGTYAARDDHARSIVCSTLAGSTIPGGELIKMLIESGLTRPTAYRARADLLKDGTLRNVGTEARPVFEVRG